MKRFLLIVLLCAPVCLLAPNEATAQEFVPTPVEISKDKVNIRGEIFYAHKVLKGHTMYSISKAYGIDIEKIKEINPALQQEGLKAGMIIYIPVDGTVEQVPATAVQTQKEAEPQSKDTEQDKTAAASETTDNQQTEAQEKSSTSKQKDADKKYKKYKPKWYESVHDVAVKFNVPAEAIFALNGIDPSSTKRIRSVLIPDEEYIRTYASSAEGTDKAVADNTEASDAESGKSEDDEAAIPLALTTTGKMFDEGLYRITIVMPFNTSDSTSNPDIFTSDFYAGALLAVNDLKKEGLFDRFVLNVVDLDNYNSSWEMIADNALAGSELIIGPISERDLHPVANYAKSRKIPVVSPLDLSTETLAQDNPYFFLFPPQSELALSRQLDKMAMKAHPDSVESVTIIHEKGYERSTSVIDTKTGLTERGIAYNVFEYSFLEGRGIDSLMSLSLDSLHLNKVIIPSLDEAFISDALRNLSLIESEGKYRINVYGMSKWKSFETLEPTYFHSLDLRLSMSYHIDYNTPETKEFIAKYKQAFNTVPSSFSYQGYDILTFFVRAMNEYGKDFPVRIINERKSMLQSDVLFLPIDYGSGYENRALKDICYTKGWRILTE